MDNQIHDGDAVEGDAGTASEEEADDWLKNLLALGRVYNQVHELDFPKVGLEKQLD